MCPTARRRRFPISLGGSFPNEKKKKRKRKRMDNIRKGARSERFDSAHVINPSVDSPDRIEPATYRLRGDTLNHRETTIHRTMYVFKRGRNHIVANRPEARKCAGPTREISHSHRIQKFPFFFAIENRDLDANLKPSSSRVEISTLHVKVYRATRSLLRRHPYKKLRHLLEKANNMMYGRRGRGSLQRKFQFSIYKGGIFGISSADPAPGVGGARRPG
ncbi:hypothetical protein EVAR_35828_1 [Eumeta japonica]|uniref:Uncharacterized protein n=1 Tax=Eumeta variegata TaxID=151549 RepID=A0A4C1WXG3_EUMVA|nr:hypothetical protein EVAR_35828_1 [Eumeta japonica]